ncbi:MAG: hypothetical protein JWO84_218, partial [Parcubacteria group bacterium]|nr:hypothetical protein [Parcubacteria group bacterium]
MTQFKNWARGLALVSVTAASLMAGTSSYAQIAPGASRAAAAPAAKAAPDDSIPMRYVGSPIVHVPGARNKIGYPDLTYLQTPEQVQAFVDQYGAQALQELQDNDIGECGDITAFNVLVDQLDQKILTHDQKTNKLHKQQPLHEGVQMAETAMGGA